MGSFRSLVTGLICGFCVVAARADDISGAGSTFAAPLYARWATDYQKAGQGKVIYRGTGSTDGLKQVVAREVDFAGSDVPLTDDQLAKAGLRQFPTAIGGVVPVVNLPGLKAGQVMLTGEVLGQIFLGKILFWDDPAIKRLNPQIKMPNTPIAVVRRLDGSGTTLIWTHYLSEVSPEWKRRVGEGASVHWPLGIGGRGNEGVATFVGYLPGAIGYIAWDFTKQNHLTYLAVTNASGNIVVPGPQSFNAAAASADWSGSLSPLLTNRPGKDAWPIMGATYVLMRAGDDKPAHAQALVKFFDWAFTHEQPTIAALDYIALPQPVLATIRTRWSSDSPGDPTRTKAIAGQ